MNKRGLDKDLIAVLISTLITVVCWVGFEVYRAYTQVKPPVGAEELLAPLSPSLDTQILDILERRKN